MTKRFCPKCGKTITSGVLCSDCTTTQLKYEMPKIQVSEFNRVFTKGRWVHFDDIDAIIIQSVRDALGDKNAVVELEAFEFEPKPKEKIKFNAYTTIDGAQVTLPVQLGYKQCDFGQKQKTAYYEGILQLRRPHEEALAFLEHELKKVEKKGVFITKTVETKNGVDLYFTNKEAMKLLAQKLPVKFGGHISINPQLFSRNKQTSKDIYRLNILVEFPEFSAGHVISFTKNDHSHTALVTKMGKLIQAKNLYTGKLVSFELKFITDIVVEDLKETTVVQTEPELLVLNPETYQAEVVANSDVLKGRYNADDNIIVVQTSQGVLLVEEANIKA